MTAIDYEDAYLSTVKNPLVYQDDLIASASIIISDCAKALKTTRASFWLLSEESAAIEGQAEMDCLALYDAPSGTFESGAVLSQALFPRYFDALYRGRVLDAVDTFTDPRTSELTETYLSVLDVRSLLDATIRDVRTGDLQGVLCAEMVGAQRDWTTDEKMFVASMSDLLSQRLITNEWNKSQSSYQSLYEHTTDAIMVFRNGVFQQVNPAACEMFGANADQLIGMTPVERSPEFQPDGRPSGPAAMAYIEQSMKGTPQTFEWVHTRLDGTEFDAEITLKSIDVSGEQTLFAMATDITERKKAEQVAKLAQLELEHRASHDSLTGLLNRDQLHGHVEGMISKISKPNHRLGLILLDLNHFKEINDTLGHSTGDKVLVAVAAQLSNHVSALHGTLFRLGGDEFVAVFCSESANAPFDDLVAEIHKCLAAPISIGEMSFELNASIGAAVYPTDGLDSHELLRCADVAMYHCKNNGDASPWYREENDLSNQSRVSMAAELRQALREDELLLHFQPRINIKTGAVTGCEALVRWQHPERGLIAPAEFLPVAETSDLIHPLTDTVLDLAFDQITQLRSLGYHVPVAVNLSARSLPDNQLFDTIETRLAQEGIDPSLLEVEVTESALIDNSQRSIHNLLRLEALGVSIAIDDFGTGYSSLSLLKELPLNTLKIDRSFVNDMLTSDRDRVIVTSTISLAHNFSARVVAEGVENQETLDALEALDCEEAQGYHIARPMPAGLFVQWLSEQPAQQFDAQVAA